MENENYIQNSELQNEQMKDESEVFNSFINVMVQIVEKYGKNSFARIGLCMRKLRSLTYHISL